MRKYFIFVGAAFLSVCGMVLLIKESTSAPVAIDWLAFSLTLAAGLTFIGIGIFRKK